MQVSPINATALLIEWTPSYLWDGYAIDYYKINISNTVFINSSIPQLIHLNTSVVPFVSCSLLNFSVSAVNVYYGESDPTTAITQFDAGNYVNAYLAGCEVIYLYMPVTGIYNYVGPATSGQVFLFIGILRFCG